VATQSRNARAEARRREQEEQRRAEARRQRLLFGGIGIAVLALAILIAVISVGETDDALSLSDVAGNPQVSGETLPPIPEGGEDPAVGSPAPVVEGEDFDGNPVTIGEDGTPQLLTFVASWCPACNAELPEVVSWLEDGGPPGDVEFTMVVTNHDDSRTNWPPQEWLADAGYPGTALVDGLGSEVFQAFGLRATPSWVVVGSEGDILHRSSGVLDPSQYDQLAELARTG